MIKNDKKSLAQPHAKIKFSTKKLQKINKNYKKYVQIVRIIGKNFLKNFCENFQLIEFSEKLYHKFCEKSNFP